MAKLKVDGIALIAVLIAALGWFVPSPALAATDVPAAIRGRLRHFAECMVDVQGTQVFRYLRLPPGSADATKLGLRLVNDHPGCMNLTGTTVIHGEAFRGSLANAMLRHRPALLEAVAIRPAAAPRRLSGGLREMAFMSAFAACLVAAERAKAINVIRTTEMSEDERSAIMSLGEAMKGCIPSETAYHLNYGDLRSFLAAAIFDSAVGNASGSSS